VKIYILFVIYAVGGKFEKANAISGWRALMGATNPDEAAENTLRKLYGSNIGENALHGSDSPETAHQEISFLFPDLAS